MISIVIPNLHSPILKRTLDSLEQQDYPGDFEVIVVGQDRYNQVRTTGRTVFLETPKPTPPAIARNLGARTAKGNIIIFIDADCVAAPDWLSRYDKHFQDPSVGVVGGGVTFPSDAYWTLCDNVGTFYEYLSSSRAGTRQQLPSLNLAIRRSIFDRVGYFDERYPFPAGEDADLTTRFRMAGLTLHFDPKAQVTHLPQRRTISSIFKHAYVFGQYSIKVDRRYMDFLHTPRVLRSWWMTLAFSPLLAAAVIVRILRNPHNWRFLHTIPIIYLSKIVWCFGAAKTLRRGYVLKADEE